ncbi:MAG TPA: transposase [Urbifossiella sp.]|nr:transposase [Urbifossiella sp.]
MAQEGLAATQKRVRRQNPHRVLIDETGRFLSPLVRRSWASRGKTPVLGGDGGHRKKVRVIGARRVSPVARRPGRYSSTRPDGFCTAEAVVTFLRGLLGNRRGKVVVPWDGGGNHKGPRIREFLRRNKRLGLERLPASAPEWNPVEAVWSWLKYGQLANDVPDAMTDLDDEIMDRLIEWKCDPNVLRNRWDGSDLPFPQARRGKQGSLPADQ